MIQDLLVSVFVPVYNGDKYLVETLNSIQNQTYRKIEVLLVDDSSTDDSKIILEEFATKDNRFKVFSKKNGGMVSISWNFIMPEIKGDYVFYSSQDDIFSIDLIEKMVEKQKETNADSIIPDMELYFEDRQNNKKMIGLHGDRSIVLSGKEACIASLDWDIHGFSLTKTSLIRSEFFFEDAFDTDEFITRKLFLNSNRVVFCEGIFYYRQDNLHAITKTFTTKNFYVLLTQFRLYNLLQDNNFETKHVFNVQKKMLNKYFDLLRAYNTYSFKDKNQQIEIELFLSKFCKKQFDYSFCFKNIGYAFRFRQLKYLLKLILCKFF